MSRPSWDRPDAACPSGASLDRPTWDQPGADFDPPPAAAPADDDDPFAVYLLDLRMRGKISSKDVCLLSFFAKQAGLRGEAEQFAFRPGAPTGHYQRHLDVVTDMTSKLEGAYYADVPSYDHSHNGRFKMHMPFLPLHESLQAELDADPSIADRLKASLASGSREWSSVYHNHPIVQASPDSCVYPIAIYMDGVQFLERDGLLAVYAYNLVTQVCHLVCAVRKSQTCRCSCGGWCSWYVVMSILRWSIDSLARGSMPSSRHNGGDFIASDSTRSAAAGSAILKGCIMHIKGDWMEYFHTLGLPRWDNVMHPCFACHASKDQLKSLGDLSAISPPFRMKTAREYDSACDACEIWVACTSMIQVRRLSAALVYDGELGKGRSLERDVIVNDIQLFAGDRLEPSPSLEDIGDFNPDDVHLPCRVLFWRAKSNTVTLRRNPLFSQLASVSVESLAIDALHCLHLGVFRDFCTRALWVLISNDPWHVGGDDYMRFKQLRAELSHWYDVRKRNFPKDPLYAVRELRLTMIGSATHPCCATKAAETGTLLHFCRDMLYRYRTQLDAEGLKCLEVGDALFQVRDLMRNRPICFSNEDIHKFVDAVSRAFVVRELAGVAWAPKWHLMLHLAHQTYVKGNPHFSRHFWMNPTMGRLRD